MDSSLNMILKCAYLCKELIRYYTIPGSNVYVAYLDASKAFDRVNHNKTFSKLCILGVSKYHHCIMSLVL